MGALDKAIDTIWSNHRCHGHFLAYCGDAHGLFAEILGRAGGVCGGRGGSQHIARRYFFSGGIPGGLVQIAVACEGRVDEQEGGSTLMTLGARYNKKKKERA